MSNFDKQWVRAEIGKVIKADRWSETDVYSTGCGYVDAKHGGYIAAPIIHSDKTHRQELFVRTRSSREETVKLNDAGATFREGSNIAYAFSSANGGSGSLLFVTNLDTDKNHSTPVRFSKTVDEPIKKGPWLFIPAILVAGCMLIPLANDKWAGYAWDAWPASKPEIDRIAIYNRKLAAIAVRQ